MIPPSTRPPSTPTISTINTTLDEDQTSFYEELENLSNEKHETKLLVCEPKNSTKTMTPKNTSTRSAQNKMKEIEKPTTPLVHQLHKVSNAKVIENDGKDYGRKSRIGRTKREK